MNRSIFKFLVIKYLFYGLILLFYYFLNYNVYCFSIKGVSDPLLKKLKYKNVVFRCSNSILDNNAFSSLDLFLINKSNHNLNFSISKYYEIKDGFVTSFCHKTCYAHPNLFFGIYDNLYFNLQFSHKVYNSNFDFFTKKNIINNPINQYLCSQLYIYDSNLHQQFLNFNQLNLNKNIAYYTNLDSIKIQNYVNFNNIAFKNVVSKSLKF